VLQSTGEAIALVSVILPARILGLVLAPLLGPLADRFDRQKIMIFSDLLVLIPLALMMYLSFTGSLTVLVLALLLMLSQIIYSLFESCSNSVLPQLVAKDDLPSATANMQGMEAIMMVLGGLLGATLAAMYPLWLLAGLTIVGALISFICIFSINADFSADHLDEKDSEYGVSKWWADLKEGYRYLASIKVMMMMCGICMVLGFFAAPIVITSEILVIRDLQLSATYLGYLNAIYAVGMILSMGVYQLLSRFTQQPRFTFLLFVCLGLELVAIGFFQLYWVTFGCFLLLGATNGLLNIPLQSQMMAAIKNEYRGRVMSLLGLMLGAISPIAIALVGIALDIFNSYQVLFFLGVGILVFCPIMYLSKPLGRFLNQPSARVEVWLGRVYPESKNTINKQL
jgi:DHA3 family macrolide efflux protein-like MFS transporter